MDLHFLHYMLHNWADKDCLTVLNNTRSAMCKDQPVSRAQLISVIVVRTACMYPSFVQYIMLDSEIAYQFAIGRLVVGHSIAYQSIWDSAEALPPEVAIA